MTNDSNVQDNQQEATETNGSQAEQGSSESTQDIQNDVLEDQREIKAEPEIDFASKCKELEDQLLRVRADHENFRKALMKDNEKQVGIAVKRILSGFLLVMNAFDQGLQAATQAKDVQGVLSGMKMVESMFKTALTDAGVKEIAAEVGSAFDPNFHQPISQIESAEHDEGSIMSVASKGYQFKEMLLQPSMVIVSKKPVAKPEETSAEESK